MRVTAFFLPPGSFAEFLWQPDKFTRFRELNRHQPVDGVDQVCLYLVNAIPPPTD